MNELVLRIDEAALSQLPALIAFNYDEIKAALGKMLKKYKGLVVTERDIPASTKDRAALGKFITALEDARKEVKRRCLAPYEEFAAKVGDLVAMVDEPRSAIDAQLKAFEERRRAERADEIAAFFDANAGDMAGLLKLDSVFDQRWLNKTCAPGTWQAELLAKIAEAKSGLDSVRLVAPEELRNEAQSRYLESLSLAQTIAWLDARKAQAKALAERDAARRAAEAERGGGEARDAAPPPAEAAVRPWGAPVSPASAMQDPEITFTLRFTGRKSALVAMRKFMDANGIRYEKVRVGTEVA